MITIYTRHAGPRLQYIAGVLFTNISGIAFQVKEVSNDDEPDDGPCIYYGIRQNHSICIPSETVLTDTDIRQYNIRYTDEPVPEIWFGTSVEPTPDFNFDIFSAAFYLLTEYEYYLPQRLDIHGRYLEENSVFSKAVFKNKPVLNLYADMLWQKLKEKYPALEKKSPAFDYRITFDIDAPFLYKGMPAWFSAIRVLKNFLTGNTAAAWQELKVHQGKQDPYDVFDLIRNNVPHEKLLFFFLINRTSGHDGRYTWKNKAYRKLIAGLSASGAAIGIHPSYNSFKDKDMIKTETEQLADIITQKVINARMHFLKYSLPGTFSCLLDAGIEDDYTLCPVNGTGCRNYIAVPFAWYNLAEDKETGLTLHPALVMDRSLQKYMGMSPGEAWLRIKAQIDECRAIGGQFIILFHNSTLSETAEWHGWQKVFLQTAEHLGSISH